MSEINDNIEIEQDSEKIVITVYKKKALWINDELKKAYDGTMRRTSIVAALQSDPKNKDQQIPIWFVDSENPKQGYGLVGLKIVGSLKEED